MSEPTPPLFEIGPGSLRWGGELLRAGAAVPDVLAAKAVQGEDGDWLVPGHETCIRPVRREGLVTEGGAEAELVDALREIASLGTVLDEVHAELKSVKGERAVLRGKVTRLEKKLKAGGGDTDDEPLPELG